MSDAEFQRLYSAVLVAVQRTIDEQGIDAFKRTSFFASNDKRNVQADVKQAA